MAKKMDPKLVSKQRGEIAYLAKKYKASQALVREAQKAVGPSRIRVGFYIRDKLKERAAK